MALTVTVYNNYSDSIMLDKTITEVATLTCDFYKQCDVLNPNILVDYNPDFLTANYMYIPEMSRYYYITAIEPLNGRQMVLRGKVDVLMTYKTQIRACNGIVAKQENTYNLYLDDGTFKIYQNPYVITKSFPYGFSGGSFVLIVAGN